MRPSGDIFSSCTQKSVIKRSFEPGADGSAAPIVGAREVVLLVVCMYVCTYVCNICMYVVCNICTLHVCVF